jgi:hypothetical protein
MTAMKKLPVTTAARNVPSLLEEISRARYREAALEAALIRRNDELTKAHARIRKMQSSLSWRITRPSRGEKKLLRWTVQRVTSQQAKR